MLRFVRRREVGELVPVPALRLVMVHDLTDRRALRCQTSACVQTCVELQSAAIVIYIVYYT